MDEPFPTLDPFIVVEDLGEANFLLERNPYYHMVDPAGNQVIIGRDDSASSLTWWVGAAQTNGQRTGGQEDRTGY